MGTKPVLAMEVSDRLAARIQAAWVHLNAAGDTPDAARSLRCLHAALEGILESDALIHGSSSLATSVARHHHSLFRNHRNAEDVLQALIGRAALLRQSAGPGLDPTADIALIQAATPIVWRMIRSLRHDARRLRPIAYYRRLLRLAAGGLLLIPVAWLAVYTVRLISPWGCLVTYRSNETAASLRGWISQASLIKDYEEGRPLPWMRRNRWTATWRGILQVPASATYAFYAQCNGGMRLWLDGELLIDNWDSAGWTQGAQHAQRYLKAGPCALRLEYRDRGGAAALRVRWSGGPIPDNTVLGVPHLWKY